MSAGDNRSVQSGNGPRRVFLLSPANTNGKRARMLLNPAASFELAVRLRHGTATLGEAFSFVSELYFRGKMAYIERFRTADNDGPSALVIAAGIGLLPPETPVSVETLRTIAEVPIDLREPGYREPFERAARSLCEQTPANCEVVLLGSIATDKYVRPLLEVFGDRLLFPEAFIGRGDMSRGGLMLRSANAGSELSYVPAQSAMRHGSRPPKLPPLPRSG